MIAALVMAGGRGERLRASGTSIPKPLVPVLGIPLLERNLLTLLAAGFRDVTIAVPSHTPEIGAFVESRCRLLAESYGATVAVLEERVPLGNIGAAREVTPASADVLVIYADNLTALDLADLVGHHHSAAAALTSGVHLEPFRIPYGEVQVESGSIVAYLEKPERRVLVSSGVFVLGPAARSLLPPGQRSEVSWLVNRLLAERLPVAAYQHQAPWIDINDSTAIARAEELIVRYPEHFDVRAPA
jgi:mannose-1-phosphate guanylyltransferase/phosphomannomutase